MANWKKWFLEEDVEDYLEEQPVKKEIEKKSKKKVEEKEQLDFEIQFSDEKTQEETIDISKERMGRVRHTVKERRVEETVLEEEQLEEKQGFFAKLKAMFFSKEIPEQEDTFEQPEKEITSFKDLEQYKPKNERNSKKQLESVDENKRQYYAQEEKIEDDEYFEDDSFDENYHKEKQGFIAKMKMLFSSNEGTTNSVEDEPEDYKTYLEKQKAKTQKEDNVKKESFLTKFTKKEDFSQDDYFEDDDFGNFEEQETSFFDRFKKKAKEDKINSKVEKNKVDDEELIVEFKEEDQLIDTFKDDDFDYKKKDDSFFDRMKSKLATKEDEEDDQLEKDAEQDSILGKLKSKMFDVSEEKIEQQLRQIEQDDYKEITTDKVTSNHLDDYFEEIEKSKRSEEQDTMFTASSYEDKEEQQEERPKQEINLEEKLKQLGVADKKLEDVDIFAEREGRKTHPTLAAMRVKRLKQENKIADLEKELIFEKDSEDLRKNLQQQREIEKKAIKEDEHHSKNEQQIEKLQEDFNKIERKEDKVEDTSIYRNKKDKKLDEIFDNIKEQEQNSEKTDDNYVDLKEQHYQEFEDDYRRTIKTTTVEDVLVGNEDLFEDDIDKTSKKLIGRHLERNEEIAQDVEQFRKDVYSGNKYTEPSEPTELDDLIKDANIKLEKKDESSTPEIDSLNENLEKIKADKKEKNKVVELQEDDFATKIEKLDAEQYPDYEQFSNSKEQDVLAGYSDYHLDEEELLELTKQNELEKTDIDTLTKEVVSREKLANDVDKFVEEKTIPRKIATQVVEEIDNKNEIEDFEDDFEEAKQLGIDYEEKLYTEDVKEFFVEDSINSPKIGEYKTQDRGYRPVSKEKIENNQKILDAIFDKYSTSSLTTNKSVTSKMYETNTITPKRAAVGKFKPTPVYSSIYGSAKKQVEVKKKDEPKEVKVEIYKEIADQKDTVWDIGKNSKRVPKNAKQTKKVNSG